MTVGGLACGQRQEPKDGADREPLPRRRSDRQTRIWERRLTPSVSRPAHSGKTRRWLARSASAWWSRGGGARGAYEAGVVSVLIPELERGERALRRTEGTALAGSPASEPAAGWRKPDPRRATQLPVLRPGVHAGIDRHGAARRPPLPGASPPER